MFGARGSIVISEDGRFDDAAGKRSSSREATSISRYPQHGELTGGYVGGGTRKNFDGVPSRREDGVMMIVSG